MPTTFDFYKDGSEYSGFVVSGHASAKNKARDTLDGVRVCAAVGAACFLFEALAEGANVKYDYSEHGGKEPFRKYFLKDKDRKNGQILLEGMRNFACEMSQQYKENCCVKYENFTKKGD